MSAYLRILATALLLFASRANAGDGESWTWTMEPPGGMATLQNQVQFNLTRGQAGEGVRMMGSTRPASDFRGLSQAQLVGQGSSPVRFHLQAEAGRLECTGMVRERRGQGTCEFSANAQFASALGQLGITRPTHDQQLRMTLHGFRLDYAAQLQQLGYSRPSVEQLIQMHNKDVSPAYLRELHGVGYTGLSSEQVVQLRKKGVTAEYVRQLRKLGYQSLSAEELVLLRKRGVTAEFIAKLQAMGFGDLSVEQLLHLRKKGLPEAIGQR